MGHPLAPVGFLFAVARWPLNLHDSRFPQRMVAKTAPLPLTALSRRSGGFQHPHSKFRKEREI